MIKILDIGSGLESVAKQVFQDFPGEKEYVRLDIDPDVNPDFVHDITAPLPDELRDKFDVVYVSHVMEHIGRDDVIKTMRNVFSALKNHGEAWVVVPSLEWAANEIINHKDGSYIQGMIWGEQSNPYQLHRCGFTLDALRNMTELCGLITRKAYQSPFTITLNGSTHDCIQNVVIAMRFDGAGEDPAEAIGD